jgi:hypothetical protein
VKYVFVQLFPALDEDRSTTRTSAANSDVFRSRPSAMAAEDARTQRDDAEDSEVVASAP